MTEPKIWPQDLNSSDLHALFVSLLYQSSPTSGQSFIDTHLIIRHRKLLCDQIYLSA